jgi:AcrR family transcriptional regulator
MSPRTSTGVRERIVAAAQSAFHERGYHGTSLDEILGRAGATKGGLYHHFPDKESLASAVVSERLNGLVLARWGGTDWHEAPIDYLRASGDGVHTQPHPGGCPGHKRAPEG